MIRVLNVLFVISRMFALLALILDEIDDLYQTKFSSITSIYVPLQHMVVLSIYGINSLCIIHYNKPIKARIMSTFESSLQKNHTKSTVSTR